MYMMIGYLLIACGVALLLVHCCVSTVASWLIYLVMCFKSCKLYLVDYIITNDWLNRFWLRSSPNSRRFIFCLVFYKYMYL